MIDHDRVTQIRKSWLWECKNCREGNPSDCTEARDQLRSDLRYLLEQLEQSRRDYFGLSAELGTELAQVRTETDALVARIQEIPAAQTTDVPDTEVWRASGWNDALEAVRKAMDGETGE